ncbi:hypothetical protein BRD04_07425 [Halobacteriales archaeon QS_9_67_17]|nr:MAG: hypothetical protein BRD04_07425 [Halobacteriales archaeon QS_9_67_17]
MPGVARETHTRCWPNGTESIPGCEAPKRAPLLVRVCQHSSSSPEEPHFREVLRTVDSEEAYVVPLFISEGYFTEQVIPRELRLDFEVEQWDSDGTSADYTTLTPADLDKTVHYCGPVGTHDAMTDVIVRRAESVTGDSDVGDGFGLAVVGHGTKRNENSAKAIRYHTERIRERDRFDEVQNLYMDEDPEVDDVTDFFESDDVVVVPLFVADGYHTQEDIPEDMGLTDDYRTGWETPTGRGRRRGRRARPRGDASCERRLAARTRHVAETATPKGPTVGAHARPRLNGGF